MREDAQSVQPTGKTIPIKIRATPIRVAMGNRTVARYFNTETDEKREMPEFFPGRQLVPRDGDQPRRRLP